jgi:hypothetical protein
MTKLSHFPISPGAVRVLSLAALAASAMLLPGCATKTLTASLPAMAKISSLPGEPARIDAGSAEVYGRIASGAMRCWFTANGQLKASHIFHADADPPAKGGAVEIVVQERDLAGPKPWGPRAFKVVLQASGEQTAIDVVNIRMREPTAGLMRADVFHWALGGRECGLKPIEVAAPPPVPPKKKPKPKKT